MTKEQTFPFKERDDFALSAWIEDLVNIIKRRGFLVKKEDGFLVFIDNAAEFLELYCDGESPQSAFEEFNE